MCRTIGADNGVIITLDLALLVAGTKILAPVRRADQSGDDEIRRSKQRVILFIDELHHRRRWPRLKARWMLPISSPALSRGELR